MGTITKRLAWVIGVMLPVAALTASEVPWQSGFVLTYVTVSFGLHTVVRLKDADLERHLHIIVLSGSSPILVRSYFGMDLTTLGVVHVVAILLISIGVGYLLADRVRAALRRPNAVRALLTAVLLVAPLAAQQANPPRLGPEDGLLVVTLNGKYGFIDVTGRSVIPPTFDFAWQFSEGRASAWQEGKAGFIDRTGRFVISPRFEYAKAFHEGLAEVQLEQAWGFVNTDGQLAIQAVFDETRPFSQGRAPVRVNGKWGYADNVGTLAIPAIYQQTLPFENGRALVKSEEGWFALNRRGEPIPRDPDELIPEQRDGKWGFVRPDGKVAVDFTLDGAHNFSEGFAVVQVGERWGFVDRAGQLVIPAEFEDPWALPPGGGGAGFGRGGPPVAFFKEGVAAVYKDGSWRFIDAKGRAAFPGQFAKVSNGGFRNGIAEVCGKKTCGYIDRTGRVIWKFE